MKKKIEMYMFVKIKIKQNIVDNYKPGHQWRLG